MQETGAGKDAASTSGTSASQNPLPDSKSNPLGDSVGSPLLTPPSLAPLKVKEGTPASEPKALDEPLQGEFAAPEATAKYASSIAVDTHGLPLMDGHGKAVHAVEGEGKDGEHPARGEFQEGYEKGLKGIEGLQLAKDPKKEDLSRLLSKSA